MSVSVRGPLFDDCDPKLVVEFQKFHARNPQVYELFRKLAWQVKRAGRKKYSAWTLINRIRWDFDIQTKGSQFKISNDFIALYARLLVTHETEAFKHFFKLRPMKAKRRPRQRKAA